MNAKKTEQTNRVIIEVDLSDDEALALAQFVKRLTFCDCERRAVSKDETYLMLNATDKVGAALARAGYAPR